jgi:hypothetical protein
LLSHSSLAMKSVASSYPTATSNARAHVNGHPARLDGFVLDDVGVYPRMRHGGRGRNKIPIERELNREKRNACSVRLSVSYVGNT